jgi:hypothetical protein
MPGYRDPFGYNNNPGIPQSSAYMHGGVGHGGVSPYGPHGGRVDYGRNEYYYDTPSGGMNAMSPAMGVGGYGNSGRYGANGGGAASASVLEDQLLGTYGGGINRLQTSSMRHSVGSSYGSVGTPSGQYGASAGYGGGGGPGYGGNANAGGYGPFDYDDLTGYRSPQTNPSGSIGGLPGAGNTGYSTFGAFGNNVDLGDRFATRGPFSTANSGGMNGFGINGLTPQGSAGGSGGGASPSRYDYGDDGMASPQFQASDILRQDTSGLTGYLGGGAPSASNGTGATGNTGSKPNGHPHSGGRGAGAGLGVKDGIHEMTGMFSNLAVGGQKTPISPGSATGTGSGTSFGTQHGHQHFRGDSGRFS